MKNLLFLLIGLCLVALAPIQEVSPPGGELQTICYSLDSDIDFITVNVTTGVECNPLSDSFGLISNKINGFSYDDINLLPGELITRRAYLYRLTTNSYQEGKYSSLVSSNYRPPNYFKGNVVRANLYR